MASTVYSQSFRQKLQLPGNEHLLEQYRVKNRANSSTHHKKVMNDPIAKALHNERKAESQRRRRALQKWEAESIRDTEMSQTRASQSKEAAASKAVFSSTSSESRAYQKAEKALLNNLPKDKCQQVKIVRKLVKRHFPIEPQAPPIPIKKPRKDFDIKREAIISFYESDIVSKQSPSMKDAMRVEKPNGEVEFVATFTMKITIVAAFKLFSQLYPDFNVSESYFRKNRPKHVKVSSKAKDFTCLCERCENTQLMADGFARYMPEKVSIHELHRILMCDTQNRSCAFNKCKECRSFTPKLKSMLQSCCEEEPVKYHQWIKNEKFYEKREMESTTVADLIAKFEKQFTAFKKHIFIARTQKKILNEKIKSLRNNEAVIVLDFAERFSTKSSREIQSAFFGKRQVSLFTVKAYLGNKDYSFVVASDDQRQNTKTVFVYLLKILRKLKYLHRSLNHVSIFSDGCSQHFKNRFQFLNLLFAKKDHGMLIDWHFFGSGHGKSACDGIGGCIKKHVRNKVIAGDLNVYSASDFVNVGNEFVRKIELFEVSPEEIDHLSVRLTKRFKNVQAIKGCRKFHKFTVSSSKRGVINASITSDSIQHEEFKLL